MQSRQAGRISAAGAYKFLGGFGLKVVIPCVGGRGRAQGSFFGFGMFFSHTETLNQLGVDFTCSEIQESLGTGDRPGGMLRFGAQNFNPKP